MEILIYRLEIDGHGPFWNEKTNKSLNKMCRQGTPEWRNFVGTDTFLNHYVSGGESPYDHRRLGDFLDHGDIRNYRFGFVSKQALIKEFGLEIPLYRKQFDYLLEKSRGLSIAEYLVTPRINTRIQAIYNPKSAELVQHFHNSEEFFRYL